MIWRAIKTVFAWLLIAAAVVGFLGLLAHILFQDVGLFGAPPILGGHLTFNGYVIDCTTWWGKLINLFIDLCLFAWGWGILHDMKVKRSQQLPRAQRLDAASTG